jgi:hypothetical protein
LNVTTGYARVNGATEYVAEQEHKHGGLDGRKDKDFWNTNHLKQLPLGNY